MRVLIDYDAGVGLLPKCTDLDTGQPTPDFRLSFTYGEAPRVEPDALGIAEVWQRRNGQDRLLYSRATAQAIARRALAVSLEEVRDAGKSFTFDQGWEKGGGEV